jgi:hypothetical protein
MRGISNLPTIFGLTTVLLLAAGSAPPAAAGVDAKAAFERLKSLEGTWKSSGNPELGESTHEFRVSAAGTVVMETMHPGSDHEMINMYHLDGDDLVMTHYCAGGNQPTMRLDRAGGTLDQLPFEFTGGTNLDPAKDGHIHSGRLVFVSDGRLESWWTGWNEGKEMDTLKFVLERVE